MDEQPMENQPVISSHASPVTTSFSSENLLEQLPAAWYACNEKAEIVEFNQLAVELWGRSPAECETETVFFKGLRTYDDKLGINYSPLLNCLRDGQPKLNQQSEIHRKNGSFPIIENISPIRLNGEVVGAMNVFYKQPGEEEEKGNDTKKQLRKSISDLEEKNEALNDSDEIYHKMIEEVEDYAIILLDKDGTILNWNKGAEKIKGYKQEEIVGKNFTTFYTPEDRANKKPEKLLNSARETGKALDEGWRMRKDGTRFWGSIVITALHGKPGEITGFVKVTRDLSERREAEEELRKSEERYHKMVEEVEDYAIILLDKDGTVLNWNKGAERIKGYKQEEIVGRNFRMFYTPEDRENKKPERLIDTAIKSGKALDEGWRVRKDGTRFWGSVVITALHNTEGEVDGFVKVTRELTEKKIAEEELKKSEERYHKMIDEIEDYAIILLDRDGTVMNWNKGAEKIKGYKQQEIVGKNFSTFYTPEDIKNEKPKKLITIAATTGKASDEGWRMRKDGKRFWGSIVITALHNTEGEVIGFSKVTRDLTERKNAEDKLREYSNELEFQNKELEQFAYAASHDMKEPLRKIHLYNSFINENQNNKLDTKSKEYLNRSISAVKRMNDLIEDLLTYSKSTSSVESFEKTDVSALLNEIVAQHKEEFDQKKVKITIDPMPKMEVVPFQFNQLMDNLVSNSIKYKHPDRNTEIEIKYKSVQGSKLTDREAEPGIKYHRISVSDNGIGFEPQYENKVFEIFQRLSNPTGAKGSGIGLAICKKIVQNHKGFIKAIGKLNEGATFEVYLPHDPDHLLKQG